MFIFMLLLFLLLLFHNQIHSSNRALLRFRSRFRSIEQKCYSKLKQIIGLISKEAFSGNV